MKTRNLLPTLLIALFLLPLAAGCGPKKKKIEVRSEKGLVTLKEVMEARRKRMLSKLPAADEPQDDEHPWLAWVKSFAGMQSKSEFKKVAILAKGTDIAECAEALSTWLDAQKRYFRDEKMAPKEYYRDLNIATGKCKGMEWLMDLEFERIFFHAAEAARTHDLFGPARGPEDDRVTRYFTYWKIIWDFQQDTSLFQEETTKLCKQKVGDFCKDIPMELQPFQVMKPYYDKVIAQIADYKKAFPQSPWNAFLDRITAQYEQRKARVPKWVEKPVLAPMRSTVAAPVSGNAVFYVTTEVVALMENLLRKEGEVPKVFDDKGVIVEKGDPWKADGWKADPDLERSISQLVEDVRTSTISQFNQSTILLVTEPQIPVSYLEPALRATVVGEHAKEWPTLMLVGRRRADSSNRRSGFLLSILAADKTVKFKIKAPDSGKTVQCEAWAVIGKDTYEAKGFGPIIYHEGAKITTGKLAGDGTLRSAESAEGHGEGDRLEKWADQQTTSIVVAVPGGRTYKELIEALNGVALRCEKDECKYERTQPVFLATCP